MEHIEELREVLQKTFVEFCPYAFSTDPTEDVYNKLFGEQNSKKILNTPIESIVMGENQFNKFLEKKDGRKYQMGMAYQTLTEPMIILEESSKKPNEKPSHLYVRSYFTNDFKTMLSVIVYKDESNGLIVASSVSSHLLSLKKFLRKKIVKENNLIYIDREFFDRMCQLNVDLCRSIMIKNNNIDITLILNKDYDKSKILPLKELRKLRTNRDIILAILKNVEGKNSFFDIVDNRLDYSSESELLSRLNDELGDGEDTSDVANLLIYRNALAKSLKEMKSDIDKAYKMNLDISIFEVLDYYTDLVVSFVDYHLDNYKKECLKNDKKLDPKLDYINEYIGLVKGDSFII